MNFKDVIKQAILTNTKMIVTGKSGWGKSEMIQQVADELGYELVDFRLSEVLPEDIVGIPKLKDDYYEYVPPKKIYDMIQHPEKKYLLFLDEITQGTPEVLNICYKIFDKTTKIGDHEFDNVAVIGATNYSNESNYLSELPTPLKNRAANIELDHDKNKAVDYLLNKFEITERANLRIKAAIKDAIESSNPRSTEKAISLILNNTTKHLIIPLIGLQNYQSLQSALGQSLDLEQTITNLDLAFADIQQGFTNYKNKNYAIDEASVLTLKYNLTAEEANIIEREFEDARIEQADDLNHNLLTELLIEDINLTADDIYTISRTYRTFNPIQYAKRMKINEQTMKNQFDTLCRLSNMSREELLREVCKSGKILPIDVMRTYRDVLPWDIIKQQARRGDITEAKKQEFKAELGYE